MTAIATTSVPDRIRMLPDWRQVCTLSNEELARYDVAAVNLAVALGLPGWEKIDGELCLRTLDDWAERVRTYTEKVLPQFHRSPVAYKESEAYFRTLVMITVLQRDLGVVYNPAKAPAEARFETEDSFIHGVIQGNGGTCATLPVVYTAVGRRLGYPLKLVSVWANDQGSHLLSRWVGGGDEEFNIEASGCGLLTPPDAYYRRGQYEMTPFIQEKGCYLQSQTPRMELATFVCQRAHRWVDMGNHRRAVEGFAWAVSLHPENAITDNTLRLQLNEWIAWTNARKPPGFPAILIGAPSRRLFPDTLPVGYERSILGQMATENLLLDPDAGKVWEKMRRGEWKGRGPNKATVDFRPDGSSEVTLELNP